ncbi:hypothetical protein IEQ34_013832 [Dendrobium chrysotoxum]|uniref:Uncharacterized protein n=1 Tax=Dendrobium chrysotoxum TaxID=161865 RepID=A0AAV7GQ88_DENCH|nr:hypothetical protein IEQ34_013832 [Dendrobium chrysotoxum]
MAFGCGYVHWDSAQMELLAFKSLRSFIQSWMLEANGIIIEGVNLNVINFLHQLYIKPKKRMREQIILDDIHIVLDDQSVFVVGGSFTRRSRVLCPLQVEAKGVRRFSACFRRKQKEVGFSTPPCGEKEVLYRLLRLAVGAKGETLFI